MAGFASHWLKPVAAGLLVVASLVAAAAHAEVRWITHPAAMGTSGKQAVALQFRREIALTAVPRRAVINVSGDNRFVLYVNGSRVAEGPARGDLAHWRYRPVDIGPFLRRGKNVVAASVWNDGSAAALAQVSARTGFALWSDAPELRDLDTGPAWRTRIDGSRTVAAANRQIAGALGPGPYYAASPPETIVAAARQRDWLDATTQATDWLAAVDAVEPGKEVPWTLVPDRLPPMTFGKLPGGTTVRTAGAASANFPRGPVTVPANSTATFLIDAGAVQAAYPELTVSGGAASELTLTYSEALYGADKHFQRDRAAVGNGQALGLTDTFRADGSAKSTLQPFWWRVWRFAELRVKTGAEPIRLDSFVRHATGYPFEQRGWFRSNDEQLNRIWNIGWNTVQLDAHETFMDTAYWEQLQYIGDTRIEAMVTYLVSGDPRLAVQAIEAFDNSRTNGIPQSRWPSKEPQSIPPFALLWVGMLHDYWLYQPDPAPLRRSLAGMRSVLDWYRGYLGPNGLVGTTPGWEFIDWRPTLSNAPWGKDRPKSDPCLVTLLYVGALQQAADLEAALGEPTRAASDRSAAEQLTQAVRQQCWSATRGLYADDPARTQFSQHANVLAVLYDVAPKTEQAAILDRITVRNGGIAAPEGVTGTTYYFAYYLARALDHAGLADRYLELMPTWRGMLAQNFTTWPEEPDPTRSDSHAWSAHPTADLLRIVAGIAPAEAGYRSVRVAPHLGNLTRLDAAAMTPAGPVAVVYRSNGYALVAKVRLPSGLTGQFEWRGQSHQLSAGVNRLTLSPP